MPIYDFKCTECDHQDEMMRKSSADSTMECPACHQETFSKMLSAPKFKLNGTGWYETDFKNKAKLAAKSDSKADSTTATATATANANAKTETKTVAPAVASSDAT